MEVSSGPEGGTTLLLVALGYFMGFLGEFVSYFVVYSQAEFKRLNADTTKLWREYYQIEAECGGGADGRVAGRAGRAAAAVQDKIQRKTKQMGTLKQKGTICVGLIFLLCMPLIHSFFEGVPGAYVPFNLVFPLTLFLYTKETPEEGPLANPQGALQGPPLCTTSAVFMVSMVLAKVQIQKLLGVTALGTFQQQAALAAPAS